MPSIVVWIQGSPTFPYLSSEACWVNAPALFEGEKDSGTTLATLVKLNLFRSFPSVPRAFSQTTPGGITSSYKASSVLPRETSKDHPLVLTIPLLSPRGGSIIRVFVRCLTGKTITLDVDSPCTIVLQVFSFRSKSFKVIQCLECRGTLCVRVCVGPSDGVAAS